MMKKDLSQQELSRYNRQMILSEIGENGQQKLLNTRVLVVGTGGLGSPVLQILTASGIGTIGIIDGDKVDMTNLHRQFLFSEDDIGISKTEAAVKWLKKINSQTSFITYDERLIPYNAMKVIPEYDLIIDGSDNFPTRYLVNDVCIKSGKPFISGSVFKYQGQVGVFNYKGSASYRCLFPQPPSAEEMPNCDEVGVLGSVTSVIGSLMANEALKVILDIGDILANRLLVWYALSLSFSQFSYKRNEEEIERIITFPLPTNEDYNSFCNSGHSNIIREMTPEELHKKLMAREDVFLVDVREPYEHEDENIGGEMIPLSELEQSLGRIPKVKEVIIYCKVGARSKFAIQMLQEKYKYRNLTNLAGGIEAYRKVFI